MIADYPHAPGDHCGSASLRNLADYYEWGLDEAGCFGISAGIGFEYDEFGPASRLIMGRNEHLETKFFEHLGITVAQQESDSRSTTWEALETRLESGPVLCFVDLYYLPYFGSDTHFGPHTVVVIDVTEDSVTISDSEFPEPQTVSRTDFDDAWSSEHGFWPLERRWLAVETPEPTVATATATRRAIESAIETMLDGGPDERGSVDAIRAFADDLPQWTGFDDLQWTARFAYQNIERRGTGGGAFRRLYSTFLETLGVNAGLDAQFGERMHRIADDWSELGAVLKDVSETADAAEQAHLLDDASDRAAVLANREEVLFTDLADAV
ncbi:BtrH N-terminal domain-containing protein [Halorientalis regularis]|jgi:predicted double-glycine peptidase|uniref:Butirosin biosynthesis protein H, N-terminal n=1 Tax=Halorientalis regularis TaxID=660518 RepID=A0A1G7RS44_9EURY|nr:BtrH N-terminal domain-containing protein [Halorientalis regularis]SDG13525.1 Butirosin biosynthesis protein H, N-terminal [Halorientalis regularis]